MIGTNSLFDEHTTENVHQITQKDCGTYKLNTYTDENGRKIAIRSSLNFWKIFKYDKQGNKIYEFDSDGNWEKRKYIKNKITQYSNSLGTHWVKK